MNDEVGGSILAASDSDGSTLNDSIASDLSMTERKKYNFMNFALTNARSLPPKINSHVVAFDELDLDFFMITETWITNSKRTQQNLTDLEHAENLKVICKNRPSRGGGVAIVFDARRANFKRFPLPRSSWEVVCATGKVRGTTLLTCWRRLKEN